MKKVSHLRVAADSGEPDSYHARRTDLLQTACTIADKYEASVRADHVDLNDAEEWLWKLSMAVERFRRAEKRKRR